VVVLTLDRLVYVIQLLHPIGNTNAVSLFTRWGRVGEMGQQARKGPWAPAAAITQFKKQFKAKTATNWDDRRSMSGAQHSEYHVKWIEDTSNRPPVKYMWVERDYEDEKEIQPGDSDINEPIPDSELEPEVQVR
jgi:poly [ADP-ribose] polymerase